MSAGGGGATIRRALSFERARECEQSCAPRGKCGCRCAGTQHGRAKLPAWASREEYERLPLDDPHNPLRKKDRARRAHEARIKAMNLDLFPKEESNAN